jgi:hypothetical protein
MKTPLVVALVVSTLSLGDLAFASSHKEAKSSAAKVTSYHGVKPGGLLGGDHPPQVSHPPRPPQSGPDFTPGAPPAPVSVPELNAQGAASAGLLLAGLAAVLMGSRRRRQQPCSK